jgi:mRNA interferase MazF
MKPWRGDVVLLDWPFSSGHGGKVRPALVVLNDRDNQRLVTTIVAMITSRTNRAAKESTQLLIDLSTPEGQQSGLLMNSVVNCVNLFSIEQSKILRVLGHLPPVLMTQVEGCLKATLEIT